MLKRANMWHFCVELKNPPALGAPNRWPKGSYVAPRAVSLPFGLFHCRTTAWPTQHHKRANPEMWCRWKTHALRAPCFVCFAGRVAHMPPVRTQAVLCVSRRTLVLVVGGGPRTQGTCSPGCCTSIPWWRFDCLCQKVHHARARGATTRTNTSPMKTQRPLTPTRPHVPMSHAFMRKEPQARTHSTRKPTGCFL